MAMTEEESRKLAEAFMTLTETTGKQTEAGKLFNARMDQASKATGALADAFITYNKEIYKGTSALKASAAATDKMAEAAIAAGAGLAILMPGGPLMKAVVAGLGLLTAKLIGLGKEVQLQTDDIYKAFQQLAKTGATGAGGLQNVFDSLQKVGLGTEKFAEYLKLVGDNAADLALVGGTVKKGADIYAQSLGSLTDQQRITMEMMVGDRTAQAEAVMGYIKQQRLLTLGTKVQMDTSSAAVMRYIKETDELTRITGINRAEQEKLIEQAQRNEAFQASLNKIRREQGEAAYQQTLNAAKLARAAGEETFNEFTDSLSGFVGSTNKSSAMFLASQGKSAEILTKFRNGEIKTTEGTVAAMQQLFEALGESASTFETHAEMMNFESSGLGKYFERNKAATLAQTMTVENLANSQSELNKVLTDPATKTLAKAENDTRETQLRLQLELNKGMTDAIKAVGITAEENRKIVEQLGKLPVSPVVSAFEDLVSVIRKLVDVISPFVEKLATGVIGGTAALLRGDARGFGKAGGGEALGSLGGAYAGMKAGAALGGGIGAAFGGVGAAPGAFIGGTLGAVGGYFGGGYLGRRVDENVAGAPGVSGKTSGVNPALLRALENASAELGQTIPINSGLRTREEQAQLYANYLAGKSKFPAAPPGSSVHEHGGAVDIPLEMANKLDSMGLLAKNGLARPVAGDPIHITLAKMPGYEDGGNLRGVGLVGERGPELAVGSGSITSNTDIMGAFRDMISLLEQNQMTLRDIASNSKSTVDISDRMLRIAQN